MSEQLGSTPETHVALRVSFTRAMLAPLVPAVALVVAVLLGLNPGVVVLLLLALLVVLGISVLTAFAPSLVVRDGVLSVVGREQVAKGPGGSVDLARLERARSVSYHGGLTSERGLFLFRTQLLLEDATGGRAMFGVWGWTPKAELQTVLRRAVTTSHARMDPMTWWRLGFRNDQGARISLLRRIM
ncbi:MAG TPA: hypothetical protein VGK78_06490 [Nocardioides sp.]|uniref:hypothetical protein n=1 Tax=Nocardioides sp. TaxID=35761 RepID=UPI002F3F9B74